jgi:murein DD-endopeptidase MepM/ murein hydrolase activator NlpD
VTEGFFIPQSVKNLMVIISVKTLRFFSFIFTVISWLYKKLLHQPLKWLLVIIWRKIILNIYQIYLNFGRWFRQIYYRHNNKLAIILNNKIIIPILIAMITLAVATNNLSAKETAREDFGKNSVLFALSQDEFDNHEVIEDSQPVQIINNSNQLAGNTALSDQNTQTTQTNETNTMATAQGGSALLQQNFISPEQTRTRLDVEDYIVQPGDTASSIAASFDLSVSSILWANNLNTRTIIKPGDTLKIPPQDGVIHTIAKNDTIGSIAEKYQAEDISIVEANENINPSALAVGTTIFIPGGVPPAPKIVPVAKSPVVAIRNILSPSSQPQRATDLQNSNTLLWPAKSHHINQYYSWRHQALDIDGDVGNPAYAPESGKVEVAGWGSGYGYHIIINHGNGIKTLQGHFSKLLVEIGDTVERGDVIALIGSTGWSTGAHIHFEVRVNGTKVNPFTYTK